MAVEPNSPLRLFFALWPPPALRDDIARSTRIKLLGASGRLIPAENYHLTLQFLGAVAAERVDLLRAIGGQQKSPAFELVLQRVEHWPSGIVVLVPDAPSRALTALVMHLRASLTAAGFALETRDFRAHVTLARDVGESLPSLEFQLPAWEVRELSLVASTPTPGGSSYRLLGTWPLR